MSGVTGLDSESDVENNQMQIYGIFNIPNDGNGFRIVDYDIRGGANMQIRHVMPCDQKFCQQPKSLSRLVIT